MTQGIVTVPVVVVYLEGGTLGRLRDTRRLFAMLATCTTTLVVASRTDTVNRTDIAQGLIGLTDRTFLEFDCKIDAELPRRPSDRESQRIARSIPRHFPPMRVQSRRVSIAPLPRSNC